MSKILVARGPNLGFIKLVGRGSFQNAGCLKTFYSHLLNSGITRFAIDLQACTYLDSTFLGTLLTLGRKVHDLSPGRLHVLNASPRNLEQFRNLGLDRLMDIDGKPETTLEGVRPEQLQEVACATPTRAEAGPTILEAHEALMEFDSRNVPKFKDVVDYLRDDLGASVK